MALSRVVSEIFNVEKCRDVEIWIRGHSRSSKLVPFDKLYGFLLVFYSNFVRKITVFEIFDLTIDLDLETGVTDHCRSSEPTRIDTPLMISY